MRRGLAVSFAVTCLAVSPGAEAEALRIPTDPLLARLISESLSARPELAGAEAVVQAEVERIPQAGALPDPMLQIGIQNDGFSSIELGRSESSFVSFMASQTFPWPGQLRLQAELAELGADQARQAVTRMRLSTEAEVRRAFLDLLLARDRLALLEQLEVIWQSSLGTARARYEAGAGAQSDVLRAQLEQSRIRQRRSAIQAGERSSRQTINRLRAHPLDEAIETQGRIQTLPAPGGLMTQFSVERARAESPELAAARLERTRAERSVALAEKRFYPDLTVSAGVMLRGALPPMWLATLAGPLPLFAGSKQSRALAESRARASAAAKEVVRVEQLLDLRTAERKTAFAALVEMIDLYGQGLLIMSEATAESTLSQYRVGKVTFASVLEANAGLIADREGYLQVLVAAHRIVISEAEVSIEPTTLPPGSFGGPAATVGQGSGM